MAYIQIGPQATGNWLDSLWSGVKGVGSGALQYNNQQQQLVGANAALTAQTAGAGMVVPSGGMPSWVLPVAGIAAVGLIAMVVLNKGPRSNPGGRRKSLLRRFFGPPLKQRGRSNKRRDVEYRAIKPGKRRSRKGKIYWESRRNRSDRAPAGRL